MKQIYLLDHLKKEILSLKWNKAGKRRKVSNPTLWAALNYTAQSKLADALRAAALQRGGVIYDSAAKPENYVPACYSTIDHNHKTMTFVFAGRVVLTWHGANQSVEISTPEQNITITQVHTVEKLMDAQFIAEQMAADYKASN